jgi:hypothetical protein
MKVEGAYVEKWVITVAHSELYFCFVSKQYLVWEYNKYMEVLVFEHPSYS